MTQLAATAMTFPGYEELIAQCMSMVKKLENVTDTDFAGVDFTVYDDEEADHE